MKRKFARVPLVLICAACVLLAPAAQASRCSIASVGGSYGYQFGGFVSPTAGVFIPAAGAGMVTFDGHGNLFGGQTRAVAGQAAEESYSGTYTVNSDCRGSFTVEVTGPNARTSSVSVVWTDSTNSVSFVFTTPGFTLSGTGKRITTRHFRD